MNPLLTLAIRSPYTINYISTTQNLNSFIFAKGQLNSDFRHLNYLLQNLYIYIKDFLQKRINYLIKRAGSLYIFS